MSTSIIFVAILVFGFLVARGIGRIAPGRAGVSGLGFLLLGVVLGPVTPPRVLTVEVLDALDLFVSILLGFTGFLAGLRLRSALREFEHTMAGALSALLVILAVACGCAAAVQASHPEFFRTTEPVFAMPIASDGHWLLSLWLAPEALWVTLGIAAAAGVSATGVITRVANAHGVHGPRVGLLHAMATVGTAFSIVVLGVAMAGSRASAAGAEFGLTLTEWGIIVVGFGAVAGVLFTVYLGRERDAMRLTVASVGAVTFAAGAGVALRVSPLFVSLAAGAMVASTSTHSDRLQVALQPLEHPASVLILLFAGAHWRPVSGWLWLLPVAYAVTRWFAVRVATRLAVATFLDDHALVRGLGRGLVGQGALAAAIGLGFAQRFGEYAGVVLTTVLGGMLLTDVLAARSVRRLFADAGDIHVREAS